MFRIHISLIASSTTTSTTGISIRYTSTIKVPTIMTDSNTDTVMLQQRVQQMELLLGLYDTTAATTPTEDVADGSMSTNIEQRIATLEQQCTKSSVALQEDWDIIDRLLHELSPGTALTHQRQVVAPIVYRKQEILASASDYQRNIQQVQQILNLISIGQNTCSNNSKITEQEIINAPIITETIGMTSEQETNLEILASTLLDLQHRVQNVSYQLDSMMDHYTNLISATSEKMILISEKLDMHERN